VAFDKLLLHSSKVYHLQYEKTITETLEFQQE
jgi:hypothetical protein